MLMLMTVTVAVTMQTRQQAPALMGGGTLGYDSMSQPI
jgi:hypothetical protein